MSQSQCPYCQSILNADALKCHACAEWVGQEKSWNWFAFLFGALWYMAKGMWAKAFAILACIVLLNTFLSSLGSPFGGGRGMDYPTTSALLLLYGIYCGVNANKDKQKASLQKKAHNQKHALEDDMQLSSAQNIL